MTNFGPTGQVVYQRTYSRTNPDGSKENWEDTVRRVVDGNLSLIDDEPSPLERDRLIELMTDFKVIPAGRHLWASGVPGRQYLFNCWVAPWGFSPWEHFSFTFLRLMEGGGVGANYSNHFLSEYADVTGWDHGGYFGDGEPIDNQPYEVHIVCDPAHEDYEKLVEAGVLSHQYADDWAGAFEVEDSREGWAEALVDLIQTYYRPAKNQNRVFDISRVRPEGARLKTFGGRASGPLPLAVMLREVADVMNRAIGAPLTGLDAMAIDHAIAKCVVSGGVRRSARMSIMRWDDPQVFDFINIKALTGEHWTTNISVEVDSEFWRLQDGTYIGDSPERVQHAKDVLSAVSDGMLVNGEPGIWNSELSNYGEPRPVVATNPCFHPDTIIETVDGPQRIEDITEPVMVYTRGNDGSLTTRKASAAFLTKRDAETVRVGLSNGTELIVTPNHRIMTADGSYVEAGSLRKGQRVEALCRARRGWKYSGIKLASEHNRAYQMEHRWLYEQVHGEIPQGYDVDHEDRDTHGNRIGNLRLLTHSEHASLSRYQVPNNHQVHDENGKYARSGNHGVKPLKDAIRPPRSTAWPTSPSVTYVCPGPVTDVYDISVDETHNVIANNVVAHNCGEIPLMAYEPCNLGHINLAAFVTEHGEYNWIELAEAHRLMTRFLIRGTFADVNDPGSRQVLDENRRIGVGHLGVASFLALTGLKYSEAPDNENFISLLQYLAGVVDDEAAKYSHWLRIPVPVKKRTVAPTGTIAKMPGVSEGIHPIFAKYFIRRVRFSDVDPEQVQRVAAFKADGFKTEPCQYAPLTTVVEFPTMDSLMQQVQDRFGWERAEEIVESAAEVSLSNMLRFQEMYQSLWADNAVSYTVNFDPMRLTVESISQALREYGPRLKGSTLFPEMSMPQSPYERLTVDEFHQITGETFMIADSVDENCVNGCPVK